MDQLFLIVKSSQRKEIDDETVLQQWIVRRRRVQRLGVLQGYLQEWSFFHCVRFTGFFYSSLTPCYSFHPSSSSNRRKQIEVAAANQCINHQSFEFDGLILYFIPVLTLTLIINSSKIFRHDRHEQVTHVTKCSAVTPVVFNNLVDPRLITRAFHKKPLVFGIIFHSRFHKWKNSTRTVLLHMKRCTLHFLVHERKKCATWEKVFHFPNAFWIYPIPAILLSIQKLRSSWWVKFT